MDGMVLTYDFAYAKVKKSNLSPKILEFVGDIGVIYNDFSCWFYSTSRLRWNSSGRKIPKVPGIQPSNDFLFGDIFDFVMSKRLRKTLKSGVWHSVPRKLVWVWYDLEWLLKLYNLAIQNKALFAEFKIPKIPEINLDMDNFRVWPKTSRRIGKNFE